MGRLNNITNLNLTNQDMGNVRIGELMYQSVSGTNILPKPVDYDDIDAQMIKFVENEFGLVYSGKEVPTFFYSQQRFSEISQNWEDVDSDNNLIPPFKILTRETNPQKGSLLSDDHHNIPSNSLYTIGTAEKMDGKLKTTIVYQMKQPYCVDFNFQIIFVCNKMKLLNDFNKKVIQKFKNRFAYINVNGHYMPMILNDISDDSNYDLDERKLFVQTFNIKLFGYIITSDDLIIQQSANRSLIGIESDKSNPMISAQTTESNMVLDFPTDSKNMVLFKSRDFYNITNIQTENVSNYVIYSNGNLKTIPFTLNKYDRVTITIGKVDRKIPAKVILIFG